MIDDIAHFEGRLGKVCGPARSGKTEALVRRCVAIAEQGVNPESVLVEVSSAVAAQAFRRRLRTACSSDNAEYAEKVRIVTAIDACIEVLDGDDARAATGRSPRLLTAAEYNFFLEDMKTLGQPVRRLRKMLEFFYDRWSMLEDEQEWLEPGEESKARAHAASLLEAHDAMLVQEAAYVCARFLQDDAGSAARGSYEYVLCDDYQNLSRAEQTCMCLLAEKQLIVAGNPNQQVAHRSGRSYARGFVEFDVHRRNVELFELDCVFGPAGVAAFADALCGCSSMDASLVSRSNRSLDSTFLHGEQEKEAAQVMHVKWDTPEDELNGLTKYIRALVDAAPEGGESGICVVAPNRRWARMLQRMLEKRGFAASCAPASGGIGGDPRKLEKSHALIARTKLALLADEGDVVTWRCWCGFGNHLTNSDAWASLIAYAQERNMGLLDVLQNLNHDITELGCEPFLRAGALAQRYESGREFIDQNKGRKGFALLRAVGAEGLVEFEDVRARMQGDETAHVLESMLRAWESDSCYPDDSRIVRIASYESMTGMEADWVFFVAAIDGFIPVRDAFELVSTDEKRIELTDEQRRLFYNAVSKGRRHVVISHFAKAPLELAEASKMQVIRVRAEGSFDCKSSSESVSGRVAVLRPSIFLREAGAACPVSTGGQALLASLGLN